MKIEGRRRVDETCVKKEKKGREDDGECRVRAPCHIKGETRQHRPLA